jgi:hypothetical protein
MRFKICIIKKKQIEICVFFFSNSKFQSEIYKKKVNKHFVQFHNNNFEEINR